MVYETVKLKHIEYLPKVLLDEIRFLFLNYYVVTRYRQGCIHTYKISPAVEQ